jgi:mRNA interferase YafQ
MYEIVLTTRFKKDLKLAIRRGYDIDLLDEVVTTIADGNPLPDKNKDHALSGDYEGYRECHIAPDWLLIYTIDHSNLVLILTRTGSHNDLF